MRLLISKYLVVHQYLSLTCSILQLPHWFFLSYALCVPPFSSLHQKPRTNVLCFLLLVLFPSNIAWVSRSSLRPLDNATSIFCEVICNFVHLIHSIMLATNKPFDTLLTRVTFRIHCGVYSACTSQDTLSTKKMDFWAHNVSKEYKLEPTSSPSGTLSVAKSLHKS